MMMTPRCTVQENHIDFQLTRSAAYDTLFEAVCDDLRARCGAAGCTVSWRTSSSTGCA